MRYILLAVAITGIGLLGANVASVTNLASVFSATMAETEACSDALIAAHGTNLSREGITLTKASIQTDSNADYIAQLTSDSFCGTNGCLFEICTTNSSGEATLINFGYAGTSLTPTNTSSDGMFDLILNNTFRLTWTDGQYTITE